MVKAEKAVKDRFRILDGFFLSLIKRAQMDNPLAPSIHDDCYAIGGEKVLRDMALQT